MQSIDTLTLTFKQNSLKEDSYLKTKQTPISPCRLQAAKTLSAFALFFPSLPFLENSNKGGQVHWHACNPGTREAKAGGWQV